MQVDLSQVSKSESPSECLYAITFTLISGWCQISPALRDKANGPEINIYCLFRKHSEVQANLRAHSEHGVRSPARAPGLAARAEEDRQGAGDEREQLLRLGHFGEDHRQTRPVPPGESRV